MNASLIAEGGHRVAVYYQTQYDNNLAPNSAFGHYVTPLPLITLITHLLLAAFHINFDDVSVHLNDFVPEHPMFTQMWADIAIMQANGIKVIGMLGGAAPGTYTCLVPEFFEKYYAVLAGYIRRFKLDGMDLDVEQDTPLADIIHLVKRALVEFGANLSGFDYFKLEAAVGSEISWYNAQFYSGFGSFFPDQMYLDIVSTGPGKNGLHPSRLVATTLTDESEGFGFIELDEVVDSITQLASQQNFDFGGIAGWEYWDSQPGGEAQPYLWAKLMHDTMAQIHANQTRLLASSVGRSRIWRRSQ
ncbi:endo-beta-N-acetylglucosaminidase [Mycena filopes]|nr:endo-beta-N-acetylglucosaminidase [Mycena filopes]